MSGLKLKNNKLYKNHREIIESDGFWGIMFVMPFLTGISVFLLYPLLRSIFLSFTHYNILEEPSFIGINNYINLFFHDKTFKKTFFNTVIFSAAIVPLNVILSVIFAVLLNNIKKLSTFFRGIYFLPVITSEVVFAVVWLWIWNSDYGLANYILRLIGISGPNWLGEPNWAMFAVIFTRLLKNLGMNIIILLASLQSIPDVYYEASEIDGANWFDKLKHITIPQLSPTIFLILMITIIGAFKVFGTVYILTGGGPAGTTNLMVMYLYQLGFKSFKYGKASAVGVIILIITLVLSGIQWSMRKKFVYQEE